MTAITITLSGPTIGTTQVDFHLPNPGDGTMVLNWLMAHPDHGLSVKVQDGVDIEGNPAFRDPTSTEMVQRLFRGCLGSYLTQARAWQKQKDIEEANIVEPNVNLVDGPPAS